MLSPTPSASTSLTNANIVMDLGSCSEDNVIIVEDHKPVLVQQQQPVHLQQQQHQNPQICLPPGPTGLDVHKVLPKKLIPELKTRETSGNSPSTMPSEVFESATITKAATDTVATSSSGVYGYTRYASDSPYPGKNTHL